MTLSYVKLNFMLYIKNHARISARDRLVRDPSRPPCPEPGDVSGLQGAGAPAVSPSQWGRGWGARPEEAQSDRGYTRPERLWCRAHASGWVFQWLLYGTCSVFYMGAELGGQYGAGHAAKGGLVPPSSSGGTGWQKWGSSIIPPHRQCRKLSEIRCDGGGGGTHETQRVCPKKGLGCRTLPLISLPSPQQGFLGLLLSATRL